jgi:hypothetical protein
MSTQFEGVKLTNDRVQYKGQGGSVRGATTRVEAANDIKSRVTATRLATMGVFAFRHKKQTGNVFLTVEHPDYQFVVEVPVKKEKQAREFAAKINTAGKQ